MTITRAIAGIGLFVAVMWTATSTFAQAPSETQPGDFKLTKLQWELLAAPDFTASGGSSAKSSGLSTRWLRIEAEFSSALAWADDVTLRYYVLLGQGQTRKLFVGEVTHVNVVKDSKHLSAMFMHPNAVERYGRGKVEAVAVQLRHQGRLMDQMSKPFSSERWWERYTPVTGSVLSPLDTPWSVLTFDRYEPLKPSP